MGLHYLTDSCTVLIDGAWSDFICIISCLRPLSSKYSTMRSNDQCACSNAPVCGTLCAQHLPPSCSIKTMCGGFCAASLYFRMTFVQMCNPLHSAPASGAATARRPLDVHLCLATRAAKQSLHHGTYGVWVAWCPSWSSLVGCGGGLPSAVVHNVSHFRCQNDLPPCHVLVCGVQHFHFVVATLP